MSGSIRKQVERRESDQKPVRRGGTRPAERRQHCLPLRARQRVDLSLQCPRQLMQPGEGYLGFGLDPRGGQNLKPASPRVGGGGGNQRRLADAWLSDQDERIAALPRGAK